MSRFRRVLAGSVLAAALLAVPVAPVAQASHPASTATIQPATACANCWPA